MRTGFDSADIVSCPSSPQRVLGIGKRTRTSHFAVVDRAQMQQVMIDLLKNAVESGSPDEEIVIGVEPSAHGTTLRVFDRGRGMDDATMRQALLPFYSTKPSGTGLGLAVCNEIVDAHGGRITLHRPAGGGMTVTCSIPAAQPAANQSLNSTYIP